MYIPEANLPRDVVPKDLYQLYMGLVGLVTGKSLDHPFGKQTDELS